MPTEQKTIERILADPRYWDANHPEHDAVKAEATRSSASTQSPSDEGRAFLKANEGFKPRVYSDTAEKSTIGYGHKIKAGESFPDGITRDEAERMFDADIAEAAAAVRRLVTADLSQAQFDALVSLVYNVGGSAFAKSAMRRKLNAGDVKAAATEFDDWNRITDREGKRVPDDGLRNRRRREKNLFVNGEPRTGIIAVNNDWDASKPSK